MHPAELIHAAPLLASGYWSWLLQSEHSNTFPFYVRESAIKMKKKKVK